MVSGAGPSEKAGYNTEKVLIDGEDAIESEYNRGNQQCCPQSTHGTASDEIGLL
jgi:hypothetical protein